MDPYPTKIKASCTVAIIDCGSYTTDILIGHSGGPDIWENEINEYAANMEDVFFDYKYPGKPGFYVWEGEIEPVYEDAPTFCGIWRAATKDDMANLITEAQSDIKKD